MNIYPSLTLKSPFYVSFLRHFYRRLYSADAKLQVSKEDDQLQIDIPYRIHRSPTDILKALESTLKKDYTAPKYKYLDDPYFIPISNITKRSFALSKESGRKAARYFLEKYPELFQMHKAEPLIKAYDPPVIYTEEDNVTEATLKTCIKSLDVANCIKLYELLNNKGVDLSQKTKQLLLEIFCFYNSSVPPEENYVEERWFSRKDEKMQNTWQNGGYAELLFEQMEKDSLAYCTMIQGTAKYCNPKKAFSFYEEACEKQLPVTLEAYNALLTLVPLVKEDGDFRWEHAMELVRNMNSEGLVPNLATMNALMSIIAASRRWRKGKTVALQLLAEMDRLKIEHSLGTYYYILMVFYGSHRTSVLPQILSKLSGKEFEIRHPSDVMFFYSAMEFCHKFEKSKELAYCLHSLLELGNNCQFLASAFSESIYFQNFFRLLSVTEDFDKFMEIYEKYVPNTYTPEPSVMTDIITALDFNAAYKHLPKICSDVILFEQTERDIVLSELFRVIGSVKLEQKEQDTLVQMVWDILTKIDARNERLMRTQLQWTGTLLGDVLSTCLNGDDLEKSWIIIQRLKEEEFSIMGYPDETCLIEFCKKFLEHKDFYKVNYCVQYAINASCSKMKGVLQKVVEDLVTNNILDENERQIAAEILEKIPENKITAENENM